MDLQEVIRRRRMVRRFTGEPVRRQSLDRILGNAVRGPSAGFCQGQSFLVLAAQDLARFWAVAGEATYPSVRTAPLVIVPMSVKRSYLDQYARQDEVWADESRWPVPFWHVDTGMAVLLILLTVVDEGLAAVYFGLMPDEAAAVMETFQVPADHEPIGAIAIGHPGDAGPGALARRRRPLAEMVHYGQW